VEYQRNEVVRVLRETSGRVGGTDGAAARMGVNRTTLISRMKKLGTRAGELTSTGCERRSQFTANMHPCLALRHAAPDIRALDSPRADGRKSPMGRRQAMRVFSETIAGSAAPLGFSRLSEIARGSLLGVVRGQFQ
jgi:hypothetical protein